MQVLRRYHIQDREDYKKYNKVAGLITKLTTLLQQLDSADEDRIEMTDQLLEKCAAHLRQFGNVCVLFCAEGSVLFVPTCTLSAACICLSLDELHELIT